jgi:hypothetical protein
MTLWPPDWTVIFGLVAFALASLAAQSWRELAVLIALTAAVITPIKWLGATAGFPAFAADTFIVERTGALVRYGMTASAALIASVIGAAIAMILWRHFRTPPTTGGNAANG